ncbi:PAS domain-containing protein [Paenibacillus sp. LMG 31461]|uniref:histidine kinase n=1 Tax=Paenibacillus plantarum TaxID=2654975 RepID=A0ABX1XM97_9BACL|nr:ATP-binding protein [Paenibacillus plantarum]NOU69429.1 PAS domain-containing protein [Paenibacillus plantarum]
MILKGEYPFSLLLSSIIYLILFVYSFRFRQKPQFVYFVVLMVLMSSQGLFSIFELTGGSLEDKLFWRNVQQIPLYLSPVMLLGMIMSFVGTNSKAIVRRLTILIFIVVIYWILLFIDSHTHLIRLTVFLEDFQGTQRIEMTRTPLGYLFLALNKAMGLWTLTLLLMHYRKVVGMQRTQHILLVIAVVSPFFFPELAGLIGWQAGVAEAMLPSGLLLFYALFVYNFLQVSPIVKEKVLENMTEGILIVDEKHLIIDANPAAHSIIQSVGGDYKLKGTYITSLMASYPALQALYDSKEQGEVEIESVGIHLWIRQVSIQMSGKRTGSLVIFSDITQRKTYQNELIHQSNVVKEQALELKQSHSQLEQAYAELSKVDEDRRRLFSDISHELGHPITSIQGYIRGMIDGVISESKTEYLHIVYEKTLYLQRMFHDLMELARIESGQIQFNKKIIDLGPFLRELVDRYRWDIEDSGIDFVYDEGVPANSYHAEVDPDRIEQVFCNLLFNAKKFTPGGGRITIQTSISIDKTGCFVVAMQDTGSGVAEADIPYLFERFYQVYKGDRKGSGLGLAIVKGIVASHGGYVGVHSIVGEGSRFFFGIPVSSISAPEQGEVWHAE